MKTGKLKKQIKQCARKASESENRASFYREKESALNNLLTLQVAVKCDYKGEYED